MSSHKIPSICNPEVGKQFRLHLGKCHKILSGHAYAALAEAKGDIRAAARLLSEKASSDPNFKEHVEALDRLNAADYPKRTLGRARRRPRKPRT